MYAKLACDKYDENELKKVPFLGFNTPLFRI